MKHEESGQNRRPIWRGWSRSQAEPRWPPVLRPASAGDYRSKTCSPPSGVAARPTFGHARELSLVDRVTRALEQKAMNLALQLPHRPVALDALDLVEAALEGRVGAMSSTQWLYDSACTHRCAGRAGSGSVVGCTALDAAGMDTSPGRSALPAADANSEDSVPRISG